MAAEAAHLPQAAMLVLPILAAVAVAEEEEFCAYSAVEAAAAFCSRLYIGAKVCKHLDILHRSDELIQNLLPTRR